MRVALRRRREGTAELHVRGGGIRGKRKPPPLVLLFCVGAVVLLANAGRVLLQKEKFCLGSFRPISLTPDAQAYASKSHRVKYELHTLPVDARDVTDGDTVIVYVDIALEFGKEAQHVREAAVEQAKARAVRNFQRADALQKIIRDAGYRQVANVTGEQVLAKKHRIRLRGIDAPEISMPFGKDAKEELVRLLQGKSLKILVYDNDRYSRLVGDVDCDGVFVQEYMLKKGLAWHYAAYDDRKELTMWENQAKATRTGLWASMNPEKPWEWRRRKRSSVTSL